ncbi:MAG TPA: hypothetical protein DCG69_12340 [Bacteroidales bacterium]|nr:hypothetical protein [Bacteroidales bacterium]
MKNIASITAFVFLSFSNASCQKVKVSAEEIQKFKSIEELKTLEKDTRTAQDHRAVFTYAHYEKLLQVLSNEKFVVLPLQNFKDSINDEKVLIGMRHDVDCHPFKALEMAKMEHNYGIRASYFFLSSAAYTGKFNANKFERNLCMKAIYLEIQNLGNEIGIHNDLISIMIEHNADPFVFNKEELTYFKSIGINIVGTAAHGSAISSKTVKNYQIFSNFAQQNIIEYNSRYYFIGTHSLAEYGYLYEAYFIPFNRYFSESGGVWSTGGSFDKLLENLNTSKAGDRIQILTHPVWWGKTD